MKEINKDEFNKTNITETERIDMLQDIFNWIIKEKLFDSNQKRQGRRFMLKLRKKADYWKGYEE